MQNNVFTYLRFVTGTVALLLGSKLEVFVVAAGRVGFEATELRAVLLAVGLGVALVTSKIYNEVPLINNQGRFIENNERRPSYILAHLLL